MIARQKAFVATWEVDKPVKLLHVPTKTLCYTILTENVTALGLAPAGHVVAVATMTEPGYYVISAYQYELHTRIVIPFPVKQVAVNNTISTLAFVGAAEELPYDVVFLYNVDRDKLTAVTHTFGLHICHLRFLTNNSLMINAGVIVIET